MKVILSRKGVDSGNCAVNNLIVNEKNFIVFPIPYENEIFCYQDIKLYANLWPKLFKNNKFKKELAPQKTCHLDPNIQNFLQEKNFIASFGQSGGAQTQLDKQNIGIGDIFLFWSGFDKVTEQAADFTPDKFFKNKHVIYGFIVVGDIIRTYNLDETQCKAYESKYPSLVNNPHWNEENYKNNKNNTIYVAKQNGFGMFKFNEKLILTAPYSSARTNWLVPELANCAIKNLNAKSFDASGKITILGHLQELVLDSENAISWAKNLIKNYKL